MSFLYHLLEILILKQYLNEINMHLLEHGHDSFYGDIAPINILLMFFQRVI